MELGLLTVTARARQRNQLSMGLPAEVKFCYGLVLVCTFFCHVACTPCLINGMQKSAARNSCGLCGDDLVLGIQDNFIAETEFGYPASSSMVQLGTDSICTNPHSLCFLSTLSGFSPKEKTVTTSGLEVSGGSADCSLSSGSTQDKRRSNMSWPSDIGMFRLLNGETVSCFSNAGEGFPKSVSNQYQNPNYDHLSSSNCSMHSPRSTGISGNKKSEMMESDPLDVSTSQQIEVHPPVLDWGVKHLYSLSVAFLIVANTRNDSILYVYEPHSTDSQFYPCNFTDVSLGPGEVVSLCLVFSPRSLGFSSARLILQTSSGGFLVQVKGYAVESPYNFSLLVGLYVPSGGCLSKNLSFFNPYNETLRVKEVGAWLSVSEGNFSHQIEASCSLKTSQDPDEHSIRGFEDWLIVGGGQADYPLMAMRPHGNWEVVANSTETIMEIDFAYSFKQVIFGAFCIHLLRASQDAYDTIMVPVEVNLDTDGFTNPVSVSLVALLPYDVSSTVVIAISIENEVDYMLRIVKISEISTMKVFQIKYINGLLLFPGTVTLVATVTCSHLLAELYDAPHQTSNISKGCKLVVLTNDSSSPSTELPCQDVIDTCLRHQKDSSVGYEPLSEKAELGNRRTGSLGSSKQLSSSIKAWEMVEADEFILGSWKSQGTVSSMSVLEDDEISFAKVQVGTHFSRWITVQNPSDEPVVMQLILNSGEISDECREVHSFVQLLSPGSFVNPEFMTETRNAFSVANTALTEAYVHPFGKASLGPILFHPSNCCAWRSSALLRNNLSGVEWVSLTGFGGSFDLLLYEGSDIVQSIEFNLDLPTSLNISPPKMAFGSEETLYACSMPLSKELHAKNMGDLPLEVKSIGVSGKQCELDGFTVHTCDGFSLQPGESKKFLVLYKADYSRTTIHRDLELALPSGIFVMPMKASLALYMFNVCQKSVLWVRLKKFSMAVLLAAFCVIFVVWFTYPQVIDFGYRDYFHQSEKGSITMVPGTTRSSHAHQNQRSTKFSTPTRMDFLSKAVGKDQVSQGRYSGKYPEGRDGAQEQRFVYHSVRPTRENRKHLSNDIKQDGSAPSFLSKSYAAKDPDVLSASEPCDLGVTTGKEKGRRRRKRKGTNLGIKVSSGHSGNSTPSSPSSPATSATPNCTWSPPPDMDNIEARNPFSQAAEPNASLPEVKVSGILHEDNYVFAAPERTSALKRSNSRPFFSSSATFPCAERASPSSLASTSIIAPDARAPGPRPHIQKAIGDAEKVGDNYRYDIWGDHLTVTKNYSNSFFVWGP